MLIVEGPDLAGKTTLCHALLKALWAGARKYGPYPAVYEHFSALPESWSYPLSYVPHIKRYSVMDRFHISELCYGRACRSVTHLKANDVIWLDAMLALVGSYTVVITMDEALLAQQWRNKVTSSDGRAEMFTLEQVLEVNKQYQQLAVYNPELRFDAAYHLESESDYLSTNEAIVDDILMNWTRRLNYVNSKSSSLKGGIHEPPSREVLEVPAIL